MKKKLLCLSIALLSLCSCQVVLTPPTSGNISAEGSFDYGNVEIESTGDMFTDKDQDTTVETGSIEISLNGDSASCSSSLVSISGSVINITSAGTYILSGTLNNGYVHVNIDKTEKATLVLDNATINSNSFAPIYVTQGDKVFINLVGSNSLSTLGTYSPIDENNVDAVIYSKEDITIKGEGSLTINNQYGHGIVSKDDLKITSGTIDIDVSNDGIQANDSFRFADANMSVTALKDGIHIENLEDTTLGYIYIESGKLTIDAGQDGLTSSNTIEMIDGEVNITTGGGSSTSMSSSDTTSYKGIKATSLINFNGGTIDIDSKDDSIHCNASILFAGGDVTCASGDDGIHADTSLVFSSGEVNVTKSYEGLESQNITVEGGVINVKAEDDGFNAAGGNDSSTSPGDGFNTSASGFLNITGGNIYVDAGGDGLDSNGDFNVSGGYIIVNGPTSGGNGIIDYGDSATATISGGTFLAIGGSDMAVNFTSATQCAVLQTFSSNHSAGEEFIVKDSSNNEIFSYTAIKSFKCVLFSSPELSLNNTYSLCAGSETKSVTFSSYIAGSSSSSSRPGGR